MNYRSVEKDGHIYVEFLGGVFIRSEQDAVDILGACADAETHLVLLHESNLSSDFFDLRTRLAGEVLLKWSNYRIRAAVVISPERIGKGKFYEFALETNRGKQFYVAQDRKEAEEWLLRD